MPPSKSGLQALQFGTIVVFSTFVVESLIIATDEILH